uniref:Fignl1 interacting regulator of recombination and mitosis n=1 Tax=Oreochromis niloticus TaxID=8128 RepID=A0A669DFD1_ORENI
MFLPHIDLSDLEDECFSKILPKAVTMFDSMMKEITDQVGGLSSQNTELCALLRNILQAMMQIIDALSTCVRHVGSLEEAPDLDSIRSLPACILKILKETFQHCKDSEVVYCGRLSLVADLLQGLFKEAYSLQKGLLELLDKICLDNSASDEDVSDIVTVIHSLLDICSVISNLDVALHANTWKFLIKTSLKYQSLVEEHLHHSEISNSLVDNLLTSFHNCVELAEQIKHAGLQEATQSPEYKLFQKSAKMCRFFANTLIHYIKEFKFFLTKSCSCFHQLYLQIMSKFPPSLCTPELPIALSQELNAAALVPMDAFLLQVLPLRPFAEAVLQQDLPEHELPHCLLLVSVMGQLAGQPEEVLQLWYAGNQFSEENIRLPLFQAIFTSFRRCYTERKVPVLLPGVMLKGQAQVQVTLHQHICVHLCASVAWLPPEYFRVLECCLVEAVLQADTQTALLAADVWCFTMILKKSIETTSVNKKIILINNVFSHNLMYLFSQMELVSHFPPSEVENLPVWHHVLLRALSQDICRQVVTEVTGLTQKMLTDWQNGGYKLGQVGKVVRTTLAVGCNGSLAPHRGIFLAWFYQLRTHPVLQWTLQLLLSLSAILVKHIEPHIICQIKHFLSHDPLWFQSQILPRLSSLFGVLLAEESWLLHQHTLEAFSQFAENTNHEEVISQSLSVEETKTKVVNYLSKTVNAQEGDELRLERLKRETQQIKQHNEKLECSKEKPFNKPPSEVVPDSEVSLINFRCIQCF